MSSPSLFQNRPPTAVEGRAIKDSVSQVTDENIDEISFLLSRLSTADRASILFDETALRERVQSAQAVLSLQRPNLTGGDTDNVDHVRCSRGGRYASSDTGIRTVH
jgi:hypothetical protein